MLVVLDNCEHLLEGVSSFARELIDRTERLHLVATTQEGLKVPGEELFKLSPLPMPATDDMAGVAASGAVALFAERVRALQRDFALNESNAGQAAEICRRVGGLPLAIELAAARVPNFGLHRVLDGLEKPFQMLSGGTRTADKRHQTLRETLAWSHNLLTEEEARVFRRTGVFLGSFGADIAPLVIGEPGDDEWPLLERLSALVDKSLVTIEPGLVPRYRLLETTRAFALIKLAESGELEAVRRSHAQALLAHFEASVACDWALTSGERLRLFQPDIDNCRAALDWAAGARDEANLHIALAGACSWLWGATGQSEMGLKICSAAIERMNSSTPALLEARLRLAWASLSHYSQGESKREAAERACAIYRQFEDRAMLYTALGRFAIAASVCGDSEAGMKAVREMEETRDQRWPALAEWYLLNARDYVVNLDSSRPHAERAQEGKMLAQRQMKIAHDAGDEAKEMFSMMALQQCTATLGEYSESIERGQQLVALARSQPFSDRLPVYVVNLFGVLTLGGSVERAIEVGREAEDLESRADNLWADLEAFALLALRRNRPRAAAHIVGRSSHENRWRDEFREPVEEIIFQKVMKGLSSTFSESELAGLMACGAAASDKVVADYALRDDECHDDAALNVTSSGTG